MASQKNPSMYPTMKIGDLLRYASRFPEDAIVHKDGQFLYVEIPGDGYVSLDASDVIVEGLKDAGIH